MSCKYASVTDEYHGWECTISEGPCMYLIPNQDACADEYGEVEHTNQWNKNHDNSDYK